MSPSSRQQIIGLETEELSSRASNVWKVCLDEQPPLVGSGRRGEGEKVARLQVVALTKVSVICSDSQDRVSHLSRIRIEQIPISTGDRDSRLGDRALRRSRALQDRFIDGR